MIIGGRHYHLPVFSSGSMYGQCNEGRGEEKVRVQSLSPLSFPGLLHILTLPRHFIHNLALGRESGSCLSTEGRDLAKVIEPKSFVTRLKVLRSTFILFAQV